MIKQLFDQEQEVFVKHSEYLSCTRVAIIWSSPEWNLPFQAPFRTLDHKMLGYDRQKWMNKNI